MLPRLHTSVSLSARVGKRAGTDWILIAFVCVASHSLGAQIPEKYATQLPAPTARITGPVDESQWTVLKGNRHPLATAANDQGEVAAEQPLHRMLMVLRHGPEQDAALTSLLAAQQDPTSPLFHQWLTPQQYGQWFGPASQDMQTITGWLSLHGFTGIAVSKGGTAIEFSGNAGQVKGAFHTAIHRYQVAGAMHFANSTDPSIPTALAPVVAGLVSLNDFGHHAQAILGPTLRATKGQSHFQVVPGTGPDFTLPGAGYASNFYGVAPYDFATIYDLMPLWNAGLDGTGQMIAVVGETDINLNDPEQFRAFFGLPVNNPILTVAGIDPGVVSGDETESDLDVEWSGAVAKGATVNLVSAATTETTAGIDLSALYIVDNNLAPVMSESYSECELFLGTAGNSFRAALWQQAAAQGITVLVSAGDFGSSACDSDGPASHPMAVSGFASTPYNMAVGGTDFNQYNLWSTYWSASNNATTQQSVLGYIPEIPWNATCGSSILDEIYNYNPATACSTYFEYTTIAGSGGPSSCISSDGSDAPTCTGGYAKPVWQSGNGVPADGARDIPDVSLFASNGVYESAYVVCEIDQSGGSGCNPPANTQTFLGIGGTSASVQAMAGVMAIINQKYGRQGNANLTLYRLAASSQGASIFHDITQDGNRVACDSSDPDCQIPAGAAMQLGRTSGHDATAGYDMATGLGTIDIANLVNNWGTVSFAPTTTTLTLNGGTGTVTAVHGTAMAALASVSATSGSPTGSVSLNGTQPNSSVLLGTLNGGSVTGNVNSLPGGTYTVTAHYGGDSAFAASQSGPVGVNIAPEPSTTKISVLNYNASTDTFPPAGTNLVYGSLLLMETYVTGQSGNGTATGSVTLTDSGKSIGEFALNSQGSAMYFPLNLLLGGTHALQASYPGDPSFNASAGAGSINIAPAPSSCGLGTNTTVLRAGWTVQLTAAMSLYQQTIAPPLGNMVAPTGTLTIYSGSTPVVGPATGPSQGGGIVSVNGGITQFTVPAMDLPSATLQISQLTSITAPLTVTYSGDSNYTSCTSAPLVLTYQTGPIASQTSGLMTSSESVLQGTPATINIQVGPTAAPPINEPFYPAPTGTLQVTLDGVSLGSPLPLTTANDVTGPIGYGNYGEATVTVPTGSLAVGEHTVSVTYGGDANYLGSGTGTWIFYVVIPDFSISMNPQSLTVTNGQTAGPSTVYISTSNGFAGTVSFSCSGLPNGAACVFSPQTVVGSGSTTLTVTTMQAEEVGVPVLAHNTPHKAGWLFGAGGVACAFVIAVFVPRRRRAAAGLGIALFVIFTFGVTTCGGGSGGGTTTTTPTQPAATVTSLMAATMAPAKGASDTFTAAVSGGGLPGPTGSVQFTVDGAAFGAPVTLGTPSSGFATAQAAIAFATAGTHTVGAAYSGDATHESSASGPTTVNVPYTSGSVPGTYFVTITATSGSVTQMQTFTLIVQ